MLVLVNVFSKQNVSLCSPPPTSLLMVVQFREGPGLSRQESLLHKREHLNSNSQHCVKAGHVSVHYSSAGGRVQRWGPLEMTHLLPQGWLGAEMGTPLVQ